MLSGTLYLRRGRAARAGVCGTAEDPGGSPVQSFCTVASSNVTLTVLDGKTFEGLFEIAVDVQPSNGMMGESPHLLDVEWLRVGLGGSSSGCAAVMIGDSNTRDAGAAGASIGGRARCVIGRVA